MTLTIREQKGSPLTHEELDNNFNYLNIQGYKKIYSSEFNDEPFDVNIDINNLSNINELMIKISGKQYGTGNSHFYIGLNGSFNDNDYGRHAILSNNSCSGRNNPIIIVNNTTESDFYFKGYIDINTGITDVTRREQRGSSTNITYKENYFWAPQTQLEVIRVFSNEQIFKGKINIWNII